MSRASWVYLLFALLLVAGLWAILTAGRQLHAPPDLAGRWQLEPAAEVAPSSRPSSLNIEQSGRFFQVAIDGAIHRLTLTSQDQKAPDKVLFVLEGGGRRLSIDFSPAADTARFHMEGDGAFDGAGHRTEHLYVGSRHPASAQSPAPAVVPAPVEHPIPVLLMQIGVILALSRAMGWIFNRIGQPQVMGEMVAGIMLGPSLLGLFLPDAAAFIFPPASIPTLNMLSQVGVIFFLFLIGLELDPKLIQNRGHAAVVISHASIIVPFLLGAGATLYFFPRLFNAAPYMRFTAVALFMGAAMSITAFPVLARILTERNLHKTKVGAVTITCAAVDDVTAWCMLAFVVAIARAQGLQPGLVTAGLALAYVLAMFFLIRPFLRRLEMMYERRGQVSQGMLAVVILLVLASALTTEKIGIHALFGAFLMGTILPKRTRFVRAISEKLEDYTVVLLLPIFFAYTGLKTQIGLLSDSSLMLDALLIIGIACAGKFGGSAIAARACGLDWRESSAIGILMNTRGLMELVILNIGRELGVITQAVFAMMVLMALVTTALTTPLLNWFYPARRFREAAKLREGTFSILIPVSLPKSGGALVRLADMISGPHEDNRAIAALYLRRPVERDAYRSGIDQDPDAPENLGKYAPLQEIIQAAQASGVSVEPISFTSTDIAGDVAAVAQQRKASLVLMGFHKPVIGRTILGGTVHRVLSEVPADVAIFVDRGFDVPKRVLVPFMGNRHDRLALELARKIGQSTKAAVTVLHVVSPRPGQPKLNAQGEVNQVFTEPGQSTQVTMQVVEDDSPVDVVLKRSPQFDLVIIGVAEEWGLQSQLFGWKPERIARDCPSSLLLVRRHEARERPFVMPERAATVRERWEPAC